MPPIDSFVTARRNLPHWQLPGGTYFLTWRVVPGRTLYPEDRSTALSAVRHWDGQRWYVYVAVVMPDHVHALVRPLPVEPARPAGGPVYELGELVGSVKKFSSLRINAKQNRRGTLWQDERYDRIMRDGREFDEAWAYIRNNPVAAELVATPEEYPWLYQGETAD